MCIGLHVDSSGSAWGLTGVVDGIVGILATSMVTKVLVLITWLILPVVICLSQRLSHACLCISIPTAKLQMAH